MVSSNTSQIIKLASSMQYMNCTENLSIYGKIIGIDLRKPKKSHAILPQTLTSSTSKTEVEMIKLGKKFAN